MFFPFIFLIIRPRELFITGENSDFAFLKDKICLATGYGIEILDIELKPLMKHSTPGISYKVLTDEKEKVLVIEKSGTGYLFSMKKKSFVDSFRVSLFLDGVFWKNRWLILGKDTLFSYSFKRGLKILHIFPGIKKFSFDNEIIYLTDGKKVIAYDEKNNKEIHRILYKGKIEILKAASNYVMLGNAIEGIEVYKREKNRWKHWGSIKDLNKNPKDIYMDSKEICFSKAWGGVEIFALKNMQSKIKIKIKGMPVYKTIKKKSHYYLLSSDKIVKIEIKKTKWKILKIYSHPDLIFKISKAGSFLGIANGREGIRVGKIKKDIEWGIIDTFPQKAIDLSFSGPYLYVADKKTGLWIYKFNRFPFIRFDEISWAKNGVLRVAASKGEFIYGLSHNNLKIFWRCPCGPVKEIKNLKIKNAFDIVSYGTEAFVADEDGILRVTLQSPEVLPKIEKVIKNITPFSISIKDSILIVGEEKNVSFFSLNNFSKIGEISTDYIPIGLDIADSLLGIAAGEKGIFIYNIKEISKPLLLIQYNTPGIAQDLVFLNNKIFIADRYSLLIIPLFE